MSWEHNHVDSAYPRFFVLNIHPKQVKYSKHHGSTRGQQGHCHAPIRQYPLHVINLGFFLYTIVDERASRAGAPQSCLSIPMNLFDLSIIV